MREGVVMNTRIQPGETVEQASERVKREAALDDACGVCGKNAYGSAFSVYNPKTKLFTRICNACARKR